jgi:hypothetical protein
MGAAHGMLGHRQHLRTLAERLVGNLVNHFGGNTSAAMPDVGHVYSQPEPYKRS